MGKISAENPNLFKSADFIFSKVKRTLSSYKAANLIDEGEFPTYVKEVIRDIGIGVYREQDAVMRVKDYKAPLPDGFFLLYAAYKCTPYFDTRDLIHPQGTVSVFNDVTWELLKNDADSCEVDACEDNKIIEKITVRQYIKEVPRVGELVNPVLLRLSPNVNRKKCTSDCQNLLASSIYEITIDDGLIMTNFNNDMIYMKYYEFALDSNGVPLVIDDEKVEKAVELYIIYQLLYKWWLNNEVPDLERKWQDAEVKYEKAIAEAKYWAKFPTFGGMLNLTRRQRTTNLLMIIGQEGNYYGY